MNNIQADRLGTHIFACPGANCTELQKPIKPNGGISMNQMSLEQELKSNAYPGRGIVIGRSEDGTKAVTAYFIMGRSANSRNRVFAEDGKGIRTRHLTLPSWRTQA